MTVIHDPDEILAAWLDEGPSDLPDATRRAIVNALPMTKQARRGLLAPWRFSPMYGTPRILATALVAIVAIGTAIYLIRPGLGVGGPGPSPSPTALAPSPTRAPTATIPDATPFAFTSPLYGYSVIYPRASINSPASEARDQQTNAEMWASSAEAPWVDKGFRYADQVTMTGVAMPFPDGTDEDAWIEAYLALRGADASTCVTRAADMTAIVIDGRPARLATKCDHSHVAYVIADGRIYVFAISMPSDPDTFIEYLASIRLPEAPTTPG